MPINSMTGFARTDGSTLQYQWQWEIKTVNHKGLDIRMRMPMFLNHLEASFKKMVADALSRGSVQMFLELKQVSKNDRVQINEDILAQYMAVMDKYQDHALFQKPTFDGLLALKGVTNVEEDHLDDDQQAALEKELNNGLKAALTALKDARADEGLAMHSVLTEQMDSLTKMIETAEGLGSLAPAQIKQRLLDKLADLQSDNSIQPERLEQEIAILATKADVREEIDRLKSHVESAHALLSTDQPVGRRLDFLSQEFNREANTLCSKSSDSELTKIGLDMKALIEQFREQVQNIE